MTKTCMQKVYDSRTHRFVERRRPHIVPAGGTRDPNDGYARCEACGEAVYIGTGLHPNLGVPVEQAEYEAAYLRTYGYGRAPD